MNNRKLASALLILMLINNLVSCSGQSEGNETTSSVSEGSSNTSEETEPERSSPDFGKEDNGGALFTIYAPEWGLYQNYFFADEENGDVMNDQIIKRERDVEDYLGVSIEHILNGAYGDVKTNVRQSVMASDDSFQLALTHCIDGVASMITDGLLYDWNKLTYCDFSKDYWNKKNIDNLSVNGHSYYAISDYMLPDPNCVLFNKTMVDEFSLDDPYSLVRDGKWTLDKFASMCSAVTGDINGDGMYDINDRYGLATADNWYWTSVVYASGVNIVSSDKDGMKLSIDNDRMTGLVEKIDRLINKTNDSFIWFVLADENEQLPISKGRSLFQITAINELNKFRDADVDFGILPFPKYDEAQPEYISNDWSGLMCIPKTVGDPELVGKVTELLAYYSSDTVIPAYYDKVLGEKLSRDEDSKEMLEIIYDTLVFDPSLNYFGFGANMQRFLYILDELVIRDKSTAYASWYAKYASGANEEIEKFMESAKKAE